MRAGTGRASELSDGKICLFRSKEMWADFALRDVWNAVCLGPFFDFVYKDGRLWKLTSI